MTQFIGGLDNATSVGATDTVIGVQSGEAKQFTIVDLLGAISWRNVSGAYEIVDADIGNGLECTATATITVSNSLTRLGSVIIRKGGAGGAGTNDVTIAPEAGVTLDLPGGRNKITTQYQTAATIPITLTHYSLSGAEA